MLSTQLWKLNKIINMSCHQILSWKSKLASEGDLLLMSTARGFHLKSSTPRLHEQRKEGGGGWLSASSTRMKPRALMNIRKAPPRDEPECASVMRKMIYCGRLSPSVVRITGRRMERLKLEKSDANYQIHRGADCTNLLLKQSSTLWVYKMEAGAAYTERLCQVAGIVYRNICAMRD